MPCCLTRTTTGLEDFTAKTGCKVTIKLKGPSGVGAKIVHIRYNETEIDSQPPFQFTVKKGLKMLIVLIEATKSGVPLRLIESCNGSQDQLIARFHFNKSNPARGIGVRGLSS